MGEIQKKDSKTLYYHLFDGSICRTVKTPTEESKSRVNKNGEQVNEVFVGGLSGKLTDIKHREFEVNGVKEYSWEFTIEDADGRYILSLPVNSRISQQLLSRLPNVDFSKEIALTTGKGFDEDKGKEFQWCNVHQGKDKIASHFTKETPNGLPQLNLVKYKGKETWDNSDQLAFFEKLVAEDLLPRIQKVSETLCPEQGELDEPQQRDMTSVAENLVAKNTTQQINTPTDDLPF